MKLWRYPACGGSITSTLETGSKLTHLLVQSSDGKAFFGQPMTVKSCVQKHTPADNSMSAEDNVPTHCPIQYVTLYLGSIINSKTKQGSVAFEKVQITDLQGSYLPIWMVILHFTKFLRRAGIIKKKSRYYIISHFPTKYTLETKSTDKRVWE